MAINSETYLKGIKGELKEEEINSLPREYEGYKTFFKHALKNKK